MPQVKLHLGCGDDIREGYLNYDNTSSSKSRIRPFEVQHLDLNVFPWPFDDRTVDEILMIQVLEHLPDTYKVMLEISRILKYGGLFRGVVPFAFSSAGMNHPQHYRHFTPESFDHLAEDFDMRCTKKKLSGTTETSWKKVREWIPFRGILCYALNNMYDNVEFELIKL